MKVSVIIVNYNTFKHTCNCISSVYENTTNTELEIILVDNASTECDANDFLKKFPDIKLVKSQRNGGFAFGNNLGLNIASGDLFLLLNSDTILFDDSITKSAEYYFSLERPGVLGCRMIYPDGKVQYTARKFRSISWELADLFRFLPYLIPYNFRSKFMMGRYFRHDTSIETDWVNGAFFMFNKNILEILPSKKLDERFFMYGEDQLWCYQIKNAGFTNIFYSGTSIVHINGGSTEIGKQLQLKKMMLRNEIEIMKYRKGKTLYFYTFRVFYTFVEFSRIFLKKIAYLITGKIIR